MAVTRIPRDVSPWASPAAVIAWPAVVYGLLMMGPGVAAVVDSDRDPAMLFAWALMSLFLTVPLILACTVAAITRERWIKGRPLTGSLLWTGYAVGALLIAHWLPLMTWSPLSLMNALSTEGSASEDQLASSLVGLVAWVVVLAAGGLIAWTRWTMQRTAPRVAKAWFAERPQWLVNAAVYAMLSTPMSVVAVMALATQRVPLSVAVGGWLGMAGVGLLIGTVGSWSTAHADVARSRLTPTSVPFAGSFRRTLLGALVVQFVAVFVLATFTPFGAARGAQFVLQILSIALVCGCVAGLTTPRSSRPASA